MPPLKDSAIDQWLGRLPGCVGIGNVRYTTSGKCDEKSILEGTQPMTAETGGIKIAVSFNGNIVNTQMLKQEITKRYPDFSCGCDSDIVCQKLLHELVKQGSLPAAAKTVMQRLDGAFSVTGILGTGDLFAFKDPHGIKPLCAGQSIDGKNYAFSSETVGLDINGFTRSFELEPGELVTVSEKGFMRQQLVENPRRAFCSFEYAYFARPDSRFNGKYVYEIREDFGKNLVKEYPEIVKVADLILSVPETGDDPAMGVHEASGLRWERASRRHRYVTERAFILLNNERFSTIDRKVNILGSRVEGKTVIVTEDSIVRGDTTRIIVEKLRKAGAKRVYMFVTFPRIVGPCLYGIDMATYGQLVGSRHSPEEISRIIGAEAVCYQSIDSLVCSTGDSKSSLCMACVTGKYPTPIAQEMADNMKARLLNDYEEKGRIYETEAPACP